MTKGAASCAGPCGRAAWAAPAAVPMPSAYSARNTKALRRWEERGGKGRVHRRLRAAAHPRCEQDRQHPVTPRGQRARGEHRRHAASEAQQQRHGALPAQPQAPQRAVRHEGHTREIARVLQQGEKEKQHQDHRQKRRHAPYAGKHALAYQRAQQRPCVQRPKRTIRRVCEPCDDAREQTAQARADDVKRQVEHAAEQSPPSRGRPCTVP